MAGNRRVSRLLAVLLAGAAAGAAGQTPGTVKWSHYTGSFYSLPSIAPDGTLYVYSNEGKLVALDSQGNVKWRCQAGSPRVHRWELARSAPSIGSDGTIYTGVVSWGTDYAGFFAITPDGHVKWMIDEYLFRIQNSNPAVGMSGTVYVLSDWNGGLFAIDPEDGRIKWKFDMYIAISYDIGADISYGYASPSIGPDGTLYAGSSDGKFYAVNPDGSMKWAFAYRNDPLGFDPRDFYPIPAYEEVRCDAAIAADGTVYFGTTKGRIFALNPDGTQKWIFNASQRVYSSPVIGMDGTLYIGSGANMYAINPDGTKRWMIKTDNTSWVGPGTALGSDGMIYYNGGKTLYAIDADGNQKWTFQVDGWGLGTPAIGSDGTVYVQCVNGRLYALYSSSEGLADSDWPKYRRDRANSGRSMTDTLYAWSFRTGGEIRWSSPAIDGDGTVYVGSMDQSLYAVNADGTKKWSFQTGGGVVSSPAIGADGTIYAGSLDRRLYAVRQDGTPKWNFDTGGEINSSPAVGADSTVYIGSNDSCLYSLRPDGTLKWKYHTGGPVYSSPGIGPDGSVFVGSNDFKLHVVRPDGALKWIFEIGYYCPSSPGIMPDGSVIVGSSNGNLFKINADGSESWRCTEMGEIWPSSSVGQDGTIYISSRGGGLFAVNSDGIKVWNCRLGDQTWSSPAVGSDGTVYVGSHDGRLYAINPDGTIWHAWQTDGQITSSPAIATDGTVYVGSGDGNLYAFHGTGGGLALSSWPKFRRDAGNRADGALPCVAAFRAVPDTGDVPLSVTFADSSKGAVSNWLWDFGDGISSTEQNPAHTYAAEGSYTVDLTVWGPGGSDSFSLTDCIQVRVPSAVANGVRSDFPEKFQLLPNFPNPFNGETDITYALPNGGEVEIILYNQAGQRVRLLWKGIRPAGWHQLKWNGQDDSGNPLESGIYLLRVVTRGLVQTRKLMLIK